MTERPLFHLLALLAATSACGCKSGEPAKHPVSERAPTDLSCPEEEVSYRQVDSSTMKVEGCGRRATYLEVCESRFNAATSATMGMHSSSEKCEWVTQSKVTTQAQ